MLILLWLPITLLRAQKQSLLAPEVASRYSSSDADIRVDKTLVQVPVSVLDWKNRPVFGLDKSNFKVFDDKVEQTIESISADDEPAAVGLVFDTSSSMEGKLRQSIMAVRKFFSTANSADEFFLIEFNSSPRVAAPLTSDPQRIQSELALSQPRGKTALLDAIHLGLSEIRKSGKRRKALLVISDGGDNHSRVSERDIHEAVREGDVLIYAIAIYDPFNSASMAPEEMAGPTLLKELAEETGGREFPAGYTSELDDATLVISRALRNIYVLGFSPLKEHRFGRHDVQVKVVHTHGLSLVSSWRLSYDAAPDE
jgi:Ca-activated chloride channel homolog